MKILINASNLHIGGGVQVASSFINELANLSHIRDKYIIYVSTEVDANINDRSQFKNYYIINTYGIKSVFENYRLFNDFDIVFTIFGPCYYPVKGISIVGFAQPWIIYPDNEVYKTMSMAEKAKTRLKFFIQSQFLKTSDHLIVELEHVKFGLEKLGIQKNSNISVVYNCVSSVFFDSSLWKKINFIENENIKIGLLSRDYPHKNLNILPQVKDILANQYNLRVDFYVTLNECEWNSKSTNFKEKIVNIGSLLAIECPSFYENMDGIIFPSFLECFSATPLETMIMKKPLFASDRGFNRDICKDFAYYFDALNPDEIAQVIHKYFTVLDKEAESQRLNLAKEYAMAFSNAKDRAESYIEIIENIAKVKVK